MRSLLIVIASFLLSSALMVGFLFALPNAPTATVRQSVAMPHMTGAMGNMAGSMMTSGTPAAARLTIQHVYRGCHVWSNGKMTTVLMRLHLRPGQKLSIMDMDVDAHQLLQFGGPMRLRMSGPMTMNHGRTLVFAKRGVYHLGTKTVEMPGGMDVKTVGPDNKLRLVITVA